MYEIRLRAVTLQALDMITSFDTNDILFRTLNASEELKAMITGGIYTGKRPLNSTREDICINTITVTRNFAPQRRPRFQHKQSGKDNICLFGYESRFDNATEIIEVTGTVMSPTKAGVKKFGNVKDYRNK